ncbi:MULTISPECIES: hypothetical protein [Klebsiella pneumoniae complex]|uniref:hypothetical protein n=1 Tax=Klebsiella pneumoniae complex TaxID=3390273 RepID=UPI001E2D7AF1|nr:hypothetical protein [Klebsiella pneumoniae]HCT9161164.1 hypothetical protein [Klebsiella quasipneumoniae]HDH1361749.1 hypothetical protein [Klebsiella quasipneumoniae subsp. similipneumoniae]MCC5689805.1 hypothetical protein [Klebsiella pneumoniae]HBQ8654635.1 hypothetical protein [Klebsiella pneumoniae]HBR1624434.1 hypothetical protein [Klebsiella pneumoniae]
MTKSTIDEYLINLYLRLNGYISTGLIIHSPNWGQTASDIDIIALKYPYHQQPDRGVQPSDFLALPTKNQGKIDVIFCEVKNKPEMLRFNTPIKNNPEIITKALQWLGLFPEAEIHDIANRMIPMFQDDAQIELARTGITKGEYNFRALLCCPNLHGEHNQWALNSTEIFTFISRCLRPEEPRDSCSTRYNFTQWGFITTQIVTYFKNNEQPDIDELYAVFLGENNTQ